MGFVIILILMQLHAFYSMSSDHYFTISRTSLRSVNLVSLYPQGWLTRAIKSSTFQSGNRIREIIFVPSIFTAKECDEFSSCVDDDHFCSLLCDAGYIVHILDPMKKTDTETILNALDEENHLIYSIKEAVEWRTITNKLPARNVALMGSELSVAAVLSYLSEVIPHKFAVIFSSRSFITYQVALPMASTRVDIGAAILLDPLPINALHSSKGRSGILEKYYRPLQASLLHDSICKRKRSVPSTADDEAVKLINRFKKKGYDLSTKTAIETFLPCSSLYHSVS